MDTNALVSVIIPCYNHAPFIAERIESVLNQDYEDIEVIMLDDCSSDDSYSIMKRYADHPRVSHVIRNDSNSGNTFRQWDKGISLARGEYIWIAESDDVATTDFLSKHMKRLHSNKDVVISFSRSQMIDSEGQQLDMSFDTPGAYKKPGIYNGRTFCSHRMVYTNSVYNASMVVFRKSCYAKVDQRFKRYRHSGDWHFWFDVCMQGQVSEIPEKLNFFRQHLTKVSNDALGNLDLAEIVEIQQYISSRLNLSAYQRRCLRGRQSKRLDRSAYPDKPSLRLKYPDIYVANWCDKLIYSFDKLTNLSGFRSM